MSTPEILELTRQMGGVLQALDRGRDDRLEFKQSLTDVAEKLEGVRGGLANVEQGLKSVSTQVSAVAVERCGARLDKIEQIIDIDHYQDRIKRFREMDATMQRWERWAGRGWNFLWRVAGAVLAAAISGAIASRYFH